MNDFDEYSQKQKEALKIKNEIDSYIQKSIHDFKDNFYFHISAGVWPVGHDDKNINISFSFLIPDFNTLGALEISISSHNFQLYKDEFFSSGSFEVTCSEVELTPHLYFFLMNEEKIKKDPQINAHFQETMKKEVNSSYFLKDNVADSFFKEDNKNTLFTEFLQNINSEKIIPYLNNFKIEGFKGNDEDFEEGFSMLKNSYKQFFNNFITCIYARKLVGYDFIGQGNLNVLLEYSDVYNKIKNHQDLDSSLPLHRDTFKVKKI